MTSLSKAVSDIRIGNLSLPWFLLLTCLVGGTVATGTLPPGLIGVLPLLMLAGAVLDAIGNNTPVVKDFLGGGPIVVIFGCAAAATYLPIDPAPFELTRTFMKGGGFLDFYVASLITGSIFGMDRQFLLQAALRYFPILLGAVGLAMAATGATGTLLGYPLRDALLLVAVPIMGGGMGAGALPLAEIMAPAFHTTSAKLLSQMVPAVALANALAIITAGVLHRLSVRFPSLGDGRRLLKRQPLPPPEDEAPPADLALLGEGLLITAAMFAAGKLLGLVIPAHPYALMIVLVAILKLTGAVPAKYAQCAAQWCQFVMRNFTNALLAGLGIAYTDLHAVVGALTPTYFLLVLVTVLGGAAGAALVGRALGFFVVEASITGGLCMANMGGTGDVAVLSAAHRMHLMPFAQISSRLGGALIILLATALAGVLVS